MNLRLQRSLILGVLGSLALVLGGQVHQDPCNKAAYSGERYKYFGPACSSTCLESDRWHRRDTSDVCGFGNTFEACSTAADPFGPHFYTVFKKGGCNAGECTLEGAVYHAGPIQYNLYLFNALTPCGGWQ